MDTNLWCSFCVGKYCQALKDIYVKPYLLIREFLPITVVLSGLTMFNVLPLLRVVKNLMPALHLGNWGTERLRIYLNGKTMSIR